VVRYLKAQAQSVSGAEQRALGCDWRMRWAAWCCRPRPDRDGLQTASRVVSRYAATHLIDPRFELTIELVRKLEEPDPDAEYFSQPKACVENEGRRWPGYAAACR